MTTINADLGSVALGDTGFLCHGQLRRGRLPRPMRVACAILPRGGYGPALRLRLRRDRAGEKTDNEAVRKGIYGRCNENIRSPLCALRAPLTNAMYLRPKPAGKKAVYPDIPASFSPGAIIRRHTGTPLHGSTLAPLTSSKGGLQRAVRRACFRILRSPTDMDRVDATPARLHRELHGTKAARRRFSTRRWSRRSRCWFRISAANANARKTLIRVSLRGVEELGPRGRRDARCRSDKGQASAGAARPSPYWSDFSAGTIPSRQDRRNGHGHCRVSVPQAELRGTADGGS